MNPGELLKCKTLLWVLIAVFRNIKELTRHHQKTTDSTLKKTRVAFVFGDGMRHGDLFMDRCTSSGHRCVKCLIPAHRHGNVSYAGAYASNNN